MIYLLITGILIFTNWSTWIFAVVTGKIIDASFGYFIMPILSVFFGIIWTAGIIGWIGDELNLVTMACAPIIVCALVVLIKNKKIIRKTEIILKKLLIFILIWIPRFINLYFIF